MLDFSCDYSELIFTGQSEETCPTMAECLHHQGCVFDYGNEFCTLDPLPGFRKVMDVNITCVNDLSLEHFLLLEGWSEKKIKVIQ